MSMHDDGDDHHHNHNPRQVVYDILRNIRTTGGPGASSADGEIISLRNKLRTAANEWAAAFVRDGRKLVIMGENNKDLIQFLQSFLDGDDDDEEQGEEGGSGGVRDNTIDLDWDGATVSLHETGYGEPDYYTSHYNMKYKWSDTIESEYYDFVCDEREGICLDSEEIVPTNYFDTIEPDKEEGEMDDHGAGMERDFYEKAAIVVWPRSMTWVVSNYGNEMDDIVGHLANLLLPQEEQGASDADDEADAISSIRCHEDEPCSSQKAQWIFDRLAYQKNNNLSGSLLNKFLKCLSCLRSRGDDIDLTAAFTRMVLEKHIDALPDLMETLGSMMLLEDESCRQTIGEAILQFVTPQKIISSGNAETTFALGTASWSSLRSNPLTAELGLEIVERCIRALTAIAQTDKNHGRSVLEVQMVESWLSIFTGSSAVPNRADLAPLFIQSVARLSIKKERAWHQGSFIYKDKPASGSTVLLDSGILPVLCSEVGWSHFRTILKDDVMQRFHEVKAMDAQVSLVKQLSEPVGDYISPEQSVLCTGLATTLLGSVVGQGLNISTDVRMQLFTLIDSYAPRLVKAFIQEAQEQLHTNEELYPLVVGLLARVGTWKSATTRDALHALAQACAQTLSSKMSPVTQKVKDWSMTDVAIPDLVPTNSRTLIRGFLDDCHGRTTNVLVLKALVKPFMDSLQDLVDSGHVRLEPFLEHRWHVKIEKLHYTLVPVTSVVCRCRYTANIDCSVAPFAARIKEQKASERQFAELMKLLRPEGQEGTLVARRPTPSTHHYNDTKSSFSDGGGGGDDDDDDDECKKKRSTARVVIAPVAKKQKEHNVEVVDLTGGN